MPPNTRAATAAGIRNVNFWRFRRVAGCPARMTPSSSIKRRRIVAGWSFVIVASSSVVKMVCSVAPSSFSTSCITATMPRAYVGMSNKNGAYISRLHCRRIQTYNVPGIVASLRERRVAWCINGLFNGHFECVMLIGESVTY
jgi:hypothetical protein